MCSQFNFLIKGLQRHGKLTEEMSRGYFNQLISALNHAHQSGVVHRDLKPENILIDQNGCLKLADFGFASLTRDSCGLMTSLFEFKQKVINKQSCGSPNYAAPELLDGSAYDGNFIKVDIWSCGVILYAMVSGALPFDSDSMPVLFQQIRQGTFHMPPSFSDNLQHLIMMMLQINPVKRINMKELLQHAWLLDTKDSQKNQDQGSWGFKKGASLSQTQLSRLREIKQRHSNGIFKYLEEDNFNKQLSPLLCRKLKTQESMTTNSSSFASIPTPKLNKSKNFLKFDAENDDQSFFFPVECLRQDSSINKKTLDKNSPTDLACQTITINHDLEKCIEIVHNFLSNHLRYEFEWRYSHRLNRFHVRKIKDHNSKYIWG